MRDEAVSDVVGSMMMLAVTITLAAAVAPSLTPRADPPEPPELAFRISAAPGASTLTLHHAGGATVQGEDVRALVVAGGSTLADATLAAGEWGIGGARAVALARALGPGERVEVSLVHVPAGASYAPQSLQLPGSAAAPFVAGSTTVLVRFRDGMDYAIANTSVTLYLQAQVTHPQGRAAIERVAVNLSSVYGASDAALYDDGTHGDALPGDGTWSSHFLVPYNAPIGIHQLNITAFTMGGGKVEGWGTLNIVRALKEEPVFNATLLKKVGWTIVKDPQRSTLSIVFKTELTSSKTTIDGVDYKLQSMTFEYQPFKPGTQAGTWLSDKNLCGGVNGVPDTMKRFAWTGSIQNYDATVDQLSYVFRTEWKPSGGGAPLYHLIESSGSSQYFILRASEVTKTVGYPWTTTSDCSNTP